MIHTHAWEPALLSRALEAWQSITIAAPQSLADRMLLERAYAACEQLTARHSRSFYRASGFLSREKRHAVRALYAFCRVTDDIVDCPDCNARQSLSEWRRIALTTEPPADNLVAVAWADARQRYGIPLRLTEQLIDGVARDLEPTRYATFDDLTIYAYGVASTVGLMSMRIVGYRNAGAIPYAIKLGVALQLTNILRDVRTDAERGRIYLPLSELARFKVSPEEILRFEYSQRFYELANSVAQRARHFYRLARETLPAADRRSMVAAELMGSVYWRLLGKLERQRFDVFGPELTRLGKGQKTLLILRSWWRFMSGGVSPNYGA